MKNSKKIFPEKLVKGDTIGIISPSGPVRDMNFFDRGVNYLKSKGFNVVLAEHTLTRWYHMSATGQDKANDLNEMFANKSVKAIFPSVGGHTASQMLEFLDWEVIKNNPKIIFGFSDNAVLVNAINSQTGLVCFHSLCDIMFGFGVFDQGKLEANGKYTSEQLFKMISDSNPIGEIPKLSSWVIIKSGIAEGDLVGGNLSSLRSLIGSDYEPDWNNKILFLEDGSEPHRWDQQLGHLYLSKVFNKISGLIIGKGEKAEGFYPENYQPLNEIILRHFEKINIPIIYHANFGHNVENATLPIGALAKIDGNSGTLYVIEGAVSDNKN